MDTLDCIWRLVIVTNAAEVSCKPIEFCEGHQQRGLQQRGLQHCDMHHPQFTFLHPQAWIGRSLVKLNDLRAAEQP
jgi:hypothetical protein